LRNPHSPASYPSVAATWPLRLRLNCCRCSCSSPTLACRSISRAVRRPAGLALGASFLQGSSSTTGLLIEYRTHLLLGHVLQLRLDVRLSFWMADPHSCIVHHSRAMPVRTLEGPETAFVQSDRGACDIGVVEFANETMVGNPFVEHTDFSSCSIGNGSKFDPWMQCYYSIM
jgi:hypothetical protein